MDEASEVDTARRVSRHRGRLVLLLVILACLVAGRGVLDFVRSRRPPSIITRDWFYHFVEGSALAPAPGSKTAEPLVVRRERIESLEIVPNADTPDEAEISFVLRTDRARYLVQGIISSHHSDGASYPTVNLGRGWDVSTR